MKGAAVIRVAVSISLLLTFLYFIGVERILEEIKNAALPLFLLALLIENAGVFISARRWQVILKEKEINLGYREALSLYYMGSFFNTVMPSSFGGDVIKAYKLGKTTNTINSFSSVIMDRVAGLVAVVIIASIAILFYHSLLPPDIMLMALLIILSFLLLLFLALRTTILEKILSLIFSRWRKPRDFFVGVISAFKNYRGGRIWLHVVVLSLIYHLMLVINNYVLALSINMDVDFFYFLIFIPVSQILVALPVSIQGFGVREGSYSMLFPAAGATSAASFSLGFLDQIVKVLTSMIGGVVYALKK